MQNGHTQQTSSVNIFSTNYIKTGARTLDAIQKLSRTEKKQLAVALGLYNTSSQRSAWDKAGSQTQAGKLLAELRKYDRDHGGGPPPKKLEVPEHFRKEMDLFELNPLVVIQHSKAPSSWASAAALACTLANHTKLKEVGFHVRVTHQDDGIHITLFVPANYRFNQRNWPMLLDLQRRAVEFAKGVAETQLGISAND